jgi:hypothetical protein
VAKKKPVVEGKAALMPGKVICGDKPTRLTILIHFRWLKELSSTYSKSWEKWINWAFKFESTSI